MANYMAKFKDGSSSIVSDADLDDPIVAEDVVDLVKQEETSNENLATANKSIPSQEFQVVSGNTQQRVPQRTGQLNSQLPLPQLQPSAVDGTTIAPRNTTQQPSGYFSRSYNYAAGSPDENPTVLGQVWKGGGDFMHEHPVSMAAALVAPPLTLGGALFAGGLGAIAEFADSRFIRNDETPLGNAVGAGILNGLFHGLGGVGKNVYKNTIGDAATELAEYPAKITKYNKDASFVKALNEQNLKNFNEMSAAARNDTKSQLASGVKKTPLTETDIDAQLANLKNPKIYNQQPVKTNGISQEAMDFIGNNPQYANYSEEAQMKLAREVQETLDEQMTSKLGKLNAYKDMMVGEYEKLGLPISPDDISPVEVANWVKNKRGELLAAKEAAKGGMSYGKGELKDMTDDMTKENLLKYAKKDLTESNPDYTRYANNPNRISDDRALAHLKELRATQPLPQYPLQPNGVDLTQALGPASRYTYKVASRVLPESGVDWLSANIEHNQAIPRIGNVITSGLAGNGGARLLKPIFNESKYGTSGAIPAVVRGLAIPGIISDPDSHN